MQAIKSNFTGLSWTVPQEASSIAPAGQSSNIDTDPTTKDMQTWGYTSWLGYWSCDILVISGWQKAAAAVALGLDWRSALGAMVLGSCFLVLPMQLNGIIGIKYRIPFPVSIKASMGFYFGNFAVVSRGVIALFWFGIQTFNGQSCMALMLGAIWPSFHSIPNKLPLSAGVTTKQMIAYFMFWIIQFPLLFVHPSKLKPFFAVKAIVVPVCSFAILGWSLHTANKISGGTGELLSAGPTVHGSAYSYAFLRSTNALISGFATIALNVNDFSRYSRDQKSMYVQAPAIPFLYVCLGLISVISASCTKIIVGKVLWSPVDIIALWGNRGAVFFGAGAWLIAQIGTNLTTNSISCANDLATLFPRYVNIRRGQIIVAFVGGWCMVPWLILANATTFYNFVSGYALILGPLAAIMLADFWIIKKQILDVPSLYDRDGIYRYNKWGINWRALVTFIIGITPNLPGLGKAIKPKLNIGGARWVYAGSWIYGFFASLIVYTALSLAFPDKTGSLATVAVTAEDYWLEKSTSEGGSATPDSQSEKEKSTSRSDVLPVV